MGDHDLTQLREGSSVCVWGSEGSRDAHRDGPWAASSVLDWVPRTPPCVPSRARHQETFRCQLERVEGRLCPDTWNRSTSPYVEVGSVQVCVTELRSRGRIFLGDQSGL